MKREEPKQLVDPSVALVAHTYHPRDIAHDTFQTTDPQAWADDCAKTGGFNPYTKTFTPLLFNRADMYVSDALDGITAAVEAGIVDQNRWSSQLFANNDALEGFLEALEEYDECHRVTDRWWQALAAMTGRFDEDAFVSASEIADGLRESVAEGKQAILREGAWAEYQTRNPGKPLKISEPKIDELWEIRNAALRRAQAEGLKHDISTEFPFRYAFYEFQGNVLHAREATAADIAGLAVTKKAAPKVVATPTAKRGKQRVT